MIKINEPELKFKETLLNRKRTDYLVLHHSEVITPHSINDIDTWHKNKGWAGVGYHYFVRKDGEIFRGRPMNKCGAHCKGFNDISTSICAEGDFNKEKMNSAQKKAIVRLIKAIRSKYPRAKIVTHDNLIEGSKKHCPGKHYPFEEIETESLN